MTRIVALGYAGGTFAPAQPSFHAFPEAVSREDLDRLAEALGEDLAEGHAVVALYPSWWAEPSLQRLQTIRAALDSSRIVGHPLDAPPLAGSVLCGLAAALAEHITTPALLLSGLELLERTLVPIAHMSKVSGLRHPAPSLWQHFQSWWPWTSFGVSWWPRPSVNRIGRNASSVPLPHPEAWAGPRLDVVAIAAAEGANTDWVRNTVVPAVAAEYVLTVKDTALTERYWSSRNVVEAVAYPSNIDDLVSWISEGYQPVLCPWCGERIVSALCPFCGIDRAWATPEEVH